ncbi:AAA domain-containing protein, partial [Thermodesulfobacteriota bacterium]
MSTALFVSADRISRLSKGSVRVSFSNSFITEFETGKSWTLKRFSNMLSQSTMLDGLYKFIKSDKRKRNLIMLRANPEFDTINIIENKHDGFKLNDTQKRALQKSICKSDYFLLQGPPGTGKTKTVAVIITELLKRKQRII